MLLYGLFNDAVSTPGYLASIIKVMLQYRLKNDAERVSPHITSEFALTEWVEEQNPSENTQ
jgi:hypothetical protein